MRSPELAGHFLLANFSHFLPIFFQFSSIFPPFSLFCLFHQDMHLEKWKSKFVDVNQFNKSKAWECLSFLKWGSFFIGEFWGYGPWFDLKCMKPLLKPLNGPFQLQITASVRERPLLATWALFLWSTWLAAAVCEPTLLFLAERGLNGPFAC